MTSLTTCMGEARFISTLDLTRGYWQVPVAEEARYKTTFATPFGLYMYEDAAMLLPCPMKQRICIAN